MAEIGLVPFASTYSVFATRRAYDFLCLDIAEPNLNVNVVGGLPGLTTGYGPSHQATEDIAILRGMPNLTIVDPCDSVDIEQAVPQLADHHGPTYLRLLRGNVPTVLDEYGYRFQLGKAAELRTGRDVVFISTGLMTMRALQPPRRPRSRPRRRRRAARPHHQTARHRGDPAPQPNTDRLVVTLENHTVIGGLSETVASTIASPASVPKWSPSRCPTSSSPPAPCPPCTTATASRPTPSSARSRPNSTATPRARSTPRRRRSDTATDQSRSKDPVMNAQDAAVPVRSIDGRLGCSTISFRAWDLPGALAEISALGFGETDLGSLPGTCQHVPTPLPPELVDVLAEQIRDSGVAVRLINADVADMDDPELDEPELRRRLATLVELAHAVGTSTIMLPSGGRARPRAPSCAGTSPQWPAR